MNQVKHKAKRWNENVHYPSIRYLSSISDFLLYNMEAGVKVSPWYGNESLVFPLDILLEKLCKAISIPHY